LCPSPLPEPLSCAFALKRALLMNLQQCWICIQAGTTHNHTVERYSSCFRIHIQAGTTHNHTVKSYSSWPILYSVQCLPPTKVS
jgi:hypothetical protein